MPAEEVWRPIDADRRNPTMAVPEDETLAALHQNAGVKQLADWYRGGPASLPPSKTPMRERIAKYRPKFAEVMDKFL